MVATQAVKPTGQIATPVRSNIVVVNQSQSQNTVTSKFKFYSLSSVNPSTVPYVYNTESWPKREIRELIKEADFR